MKIIFLDIDGVLNGHDWDEAAQSCRIRYQCVKALNRIIKETGAKIVISSAWRYMIHCGAMTLTGFEYLLRTHGTQGARVVSCTMKDEDTPGYETDKWTRGTQIAKWVESAGSEIESYVILDDDDDFQGEQRRRWVRCDCGVGLTDERADLAISILSEPLRGITSK